MFTSIISFRVRPGMDSAFEEAFHACGMLTRPRIISGFVSANLIRSLDDPLDYAVVGHWQDAAAYSQWQAVAQQQAPAEWLRKLAACLEHTQKGRLFAPVNPQQM